MEKLISFIAAHEVGFVMGILLFFGILEAISGYISSSKRTKNDVLIETVNAFFLFLITKPIVFFLSYSLVKFLFPSQAAAWTTLPLWAGLIIFAFETQRQ